MKKPRVYRGGVTWVEVVVVVVVIALGIFMLLPAVSSCGSAARRAYCSDNMKHIALAIHNYAKTFGHLPGSAKLKKADGKLMVTGQSFLVNILPYGDGTDPRNAGPNTPIRQYRCPANPNRPYDETGEGYLTNYKGIGATCGRALAAVLHPEVKKIGQYQPESGLPDGVLFPGEGIRFSDIHDGTSHTFMLVETIDNSASLWTVGGQASLVTLPNKIVENAICALGFSYVLPKGFNPQSPTFGPDSPQALTNLPDKPFVACDFGATADATKYSSEDTISTSNGSDHTPPRYGPSSGHPGVVNHALADGSVISMSTQADCAAYMILTTRDAHDPIYNGE